MVSTTLIAAPLQPRLTRQSDALAREYLASEFGAIAHEREFKIESADSFIVRQSANRLLSERYGWRGYHAVSLPVNQTTNRTTLTAIEDAATIGTITVGLDDSTGMNCDDVFGGELDALRRAGRRLCEFTKLAIDPMTGNRRVLAALFHVAYIVAHRLRGRDTLVMEVNPRHVRYYQRMLGANVVGGERTNRSVNAPAVLL
ncbi:MAG: long-chain N-acyl amino acid synthase, partial [Comamonadaceae bacterium]|nr:long-chain N-acyl amino acid synthase [Comamonadaceae bacterium]